MSLARATREPFIVAIDTPIVIEGLRKDYRSRRGTTVAISHLDLEVDAGGVFGFLGPNGAGKTTTMRCLLGLARPTAGRLTLLGKDVATDLQDVISRVGALVESPKFFPTFSGRLNLELLATIDGRSSSDIGRAIETVDLADRADDNFDTYSLGMKQRLAVAATLLKDPELLILDEPANGLDPAGIRSMRDLILNMGDAGVTVFVSSHILAEIELMCDSVAIIDRGRLITSGRVSDVIASQGQRVIVTIEDGKAATQTLLAAGYTVTRGEVAGTLEVDGESVDPAVVTRTLADADLYLSGLRLEEISLESVFLQLTEESE